MQASVVVALTGDVMLGRGIDQVLRHPGDPRLYEDFVHDAREYVMLAERAHGPIPRGVDDSYVWGDALGGMTRRPPHARVINLETAITASSNPAPKGINYKTSPNNIGCLAAANVDCCVLANNHLLDWGEAGLMETLEALDQAEIAHAGAGRNADEAAAPAIVETADGGRLLTFGFGLESSGIPRSWRAQPSSPGVNLLPDLPDDAVSMIAERVEAVRRDKDVLVASLHWGTNWGYAVPSAHRELARKLVDTCGFSVIHGHSSHHPLGVEVYRDRLILYGCGDFITDYEGIAGYETFRGDLCLLYLAELAVPGGQLLSLSMRPYRVRRFRLERASPEEAGWLQAVLDRESRRFGTCVLPNEDQTLSLAWPAVGGS